MTENNTRPLSAELERRLLHGLHLEWESARDCNPDPRIRSLIPPLFALNEARGTLALWNSKRREISFSSHFLSHHPWDAVREVLLHEMAHQAASEIFHAKDEPPHGPSFRSACDILGANPKASGSYPNLRERLAMDTASSDDAITQRIHKLFALAQSSNPHESEAALSKARLLMEKYRVDTLDARTPLDEYTTIFLGKPALRHHRESYALANLLTEHYFVRCIWAMACVLDKEKMGRVLEVSGARSHVLMAEYVYHFILNTIDRSWQEIEREGGNKRGRYRKSDFAEGLVQGFSQKLRAEKEKRDTSLLPVLVEDPVLEAYIGRRYPRVVTRTRRVRHADAHLISKGKEAGKRMTIRPGVDTKKTPEGAFLTD
ncbi:hypothetical protein DSLASN_15770 [Desulfoluna limicola]|uniref:DUF2786 domain-containing protein n=1 Tax=Desulfoluna limicola TaxID=2810562 RepID=A0ABM7PE99_9BACT|nr:DUF2786 domain-containing protein [Desulfoluna limicola]BCS95945.1 hypothetical protein DSLASN_15770 [Desulfoluna limicola]